MLRTIASRAALLASNACLKMCDLICAGTLKSGFALVRPPGHHAGRAEACGFCFFNNAAIAAQRAINQHGLTRVCIVGEAASSLSAWFLWLTVDMKQTLIFTTATDVKAYFMTPTKFFIYPCIDRAMVLLSVKMV
jgi:hypothetical protein